MYRIMQWRHSCCHLTTTARFAPIAANEADNECASLSHQRQFLLGPDFLVAPVLSPGQQWVRVYFPEGGWEHLWNCSSVWSGVGGLWADVHAPLGKPAVYFRKGSPFGPEVSMSCLSSSSSS
jgi:alpha-glucosidase (family GH31 glycosyl hydrolase)